MVGQGIITDMNHPPDRTRIPEVEVVKITAIVDTIKVVTVIRGIISVMVAVTIIAQTTAVDLLQGVE